MVYADDAVESAAAKKESVRVKGEAGHRTDTLPQKAFVIAVFRDGVAAVGENADLPTTVQHEYVGGRRIARMTETCCDLTCWRWDPVAMRGAKSWAARDVMAPRCACMDRTEAERRKSQKRTSASTEPDTSAYTLPLRACATLTIHRLCSRRLATTAPRLHDGDVGRLDATRRSSTLMCPLLRPTTKRSVPGHADVMLVTNARPLVPPVGTAPVQRCASRSQRRT